MFLFFVQSQIIKADRTPNFIKVRFSNNSLIFHLTVTAVGQVKRWMLEIFSGMGHIVTMYRGGKWYLEKLGSRKILAGSWNLGSIFDKSRSLIFSWFAFTFFESRNFSPKSLGLGFLTRISASWRVSNFTICQPLCMPFIAHAVLVVLMACYWVQFLVLNKCKDLWILPNCCLKLDWITTAKLPCYNWI